MHDDDDDTTPDIRETLLYRAANMLYGLGLSAKTQELPIAPRAAALGERILDFTRSTQTGDVRALLTEVARKHLRLGTLGARHSDSLDFSDQAVWSIEAALREAYELGFAAGSKAG